MTRIVIVFALVLSMGLAACATPPPERPIDKEGIRHRSDQSKQKLF